MSHQYILGGRVPLLLATMLCLGVPAYGQNASSFQFNQLRKTIRFKKGSVGEPLQYNTIAGFSGQRRAHLQDMIRLPNANGMQYYMGTFSQNCSDDEGGSVFVASIKQGQRVSGGKYYGNVTWLEELTNRHPAGGYNHPGDLRRIGNTVVIAGQNWDMKEGLGITAFSGGPGHRGKGNPQNVLFYDVSNPAKPRYMGKVNSAGGKKHKGEIDKVTAAKARGYYYLAFNGIVCRSKNFTPAGPWEFISTDTQDSHHPVNFKWKGEWMVGAARIYEKRDHQIVVYHEVDFAGGTVSRTHRMSSPIPPYSFARTNAAVTDKTAASLSVLEDGSCSVIYTNVDSDDVMEIMEIEGYSSDMPITNLFIGHESKAKAPPGYTRVETHLNYGAKGGNTINLFYTRDPSIKQPITNIKVLRDPSGGNSSAPKGYGIVPNSQYGRAKSCDLNTNAGGSDIYMYYTRGASAGKPIMNVDVLVGDLAKERQVGGRAQPYPGWEIIRTDLNHGVHTAGADNDLHLLYSRETAE